MEIINDLIIDHWAKILTGAAVFVLGRIWGKWRAKKEWRKREFPQRVTVSLNHFEPQDEGAPLLQLRTLLDADALELLKNDEGVEVLLAAASKTTSADPVIHLGENGWPILNAVLNEIGERFAAGVLAWDMGAKVICKRYLFCLTNEQDGDVKIRKVRALLLAEEIVNDREGAQQDFQLESPSHKTRVETIRTMLSQYHDGKAQKTDFMWIELLVPVS